jgi:hypothetical protein
MGLSEGTDDGNDDGEPFWLGARGKWLGAALGTGQLYLSIGGTLSLGDQKGQFLYLIESRAQIPVVIPSQ